MSTRDRLQQHLDQQLGYSASVSAAAGAQVGEAIRFLCSELDRLQAPATISYKLCADDAKVPAYQTEGASGLDLHAQSLGGLCEFPCKLMPNESVMVWSGIAFSIPKGWEIQIRPRSSMSKRLIHACLGTIDSDYRGEIGVLLINLSDTPLMIRKHDRIAQAVFTRVGRFALEEVAALDETARGTKGFGSSGV